MRDEANLNCFPRRFHWHWHSKQRLRHSVRSGSALCGDTTRLPEYRVASTPASPQQRVRVCVCVGGKPFTGGGQVCRSPCSCTHARCRVVPVVASVRPSLCLVCTHTGLALGTSTATGVRVLRACSAPADGGVTSRVGRRAHCAPHVEA